MLVLQISAHPHQHKNQCISNFLELWFQGRSEGDNPIARGLKFGIKPKLQLNSEDISQLVRQGLIFYNQKKVPHLPFTAHGKCKFIVALPENLFKNKNQKLEIKKALGQNDIVYEDEYIVVVNKPSGLPSQSTLNMFEDHALSQLMSFYLKKNKGLKAPYLNLMHRLDKDTSGLLLFSKKLSANKNLTALFEKKKIKKTYLAIVNKEIDPHSIKVKPIITKCPDNTSINFRFSELADNAGTNLPASKDENFNILGDFLKFSVAGFIKKSPQAQHSFYFEMDSKEGLKSETDFRIMKDLKSNFLLECLPKTGRSHQLRVHLKAIGYPILGDVFYNPNSSAKRLMLHAWKLNFKHPAYQKELQIETEVPTEFK